MTGLEITLFILGAAFIIISFFIVGGSERTAKDAALSALDPNTLEQMHEAFVEKTNKKADLILHDTEDKLESLSNDKIIAVGEYSDQMLEKIENNHKEVVFLYQMLNEKEEALKATVMGMENTRIDCEKMLRDVEKATEAVNKAAAAAENRLSAAEALAASIPENTQARAHAIASEAEGAAEVRTRAAKPVQAAGTAKTGSTAAKTAGAAAARTAGTAASKTAQAAGSAAKTGTAAGTVKKTASSGNVTGQGAAVRRRPVEPQESVSLTRPAETADNLDTGAINRNDEIIALHKSGKSVMEISKLLGMGQGEVKLIIDLYC